MRVAGTSLIALAVLAIAWAFPVFWSDATALDRMTDVLRDCAAGFGIAALAAVLGTLLLYRAARDDYARLSLVAGVGGGFAAAALLVASAQRGFFAVGYNPLGIVLCVCGAVATGLGVAGALRRGR